MSEFSRAPEDVSNPQADRNSPEGSRRSFSRAVREELDVLAYVDFLFGNHALTAEHLSKIKARENVLLLGELVASYEIPLLEGAQLEGVSSWLEFITKPGEGATSEEIEVHTKILQDLVRERNVTISCTDSEIGALYFYQDRPPHLLTLALIGGLSFMAYETIKFTKEIKSGGGNKISRRKFLQLAGAALVASGGAAIEAKLRKVTGITGRLKPIEVINEAQEVFEGIFCPDENFLGWDETFHKFRNKIMALNTWASLANCAEKDDPANLSVLFFAGAGHGKAEDEFNRGPGSLVEDVKNYAHVMLTGTLDFIMKNETDPAIRKEMMYQYSRMFTDYRLIGPKLKYVKDTEMSPTIYPPTARTVFIEELLERIKICTNEQMQGDSLAGQKAAILKTVLFTTLKKGMDLDKKVAVIVFKNEYPAEAKLSTEDFQVEDTFVFSGEDIGMSHDYFNNPIVGCVKCRGKIHPLALFAGEYADDADHAWAIPSFNRDNFYNYSSLATCFYEKTDAGTLYDMNVDDDGLIGVFNLTTKTYQRLEPNDLSLGYDIFKLDPTFTTSDDSSLLDAVQLLVKAS